jgi:hypothetical protein
MNADQNLEAEAELQERMRVLEIERIQRQVAQMPVGFSGDCESCGFESKRLVGGECAPCRDIKEKRGFRRG